VSKVIDNGLNDLRSKQRKKQTDRHANKGRRKENESKKQTENETLKGTENYYAHNKM
jgi:hypothetical protein